jgi:hypothetical protein
MRRHSAHVDVNVLAELSAGLISGRRAMRIHAHLAGCQPCARVSAGLSEVGVLLSSVPPPEMPELISRRLTTAIAEEAATRSGAGVGPVRLAGQQASQRAGRAHGGPAAERRRGLTSPVGARAFAAAAAVCVVAAGGYTLVRLTSPGGSGPVLNAGAGRIIHQHAATGGPGPYQVGPTPTGQPVPGPTQPTFDVVSSGIDYQQANLSTQIASEMSKVSAVSADSAAGRRMLHGPSARQDGCVQRITSSVKPALVDAARYQGHPATVIALAHKGNQVAQAWVVGPQCSAAASDVLTHVSLPSPGG